MRRPWIWVLLLAGVTGCSGMTENATDATTSSVNARGDALGSWISEMEKTPEVLAYLNALIQNGGAQGDEASCSDAAVSEMLSSRNGQAVIVQPLRDNTEQGLAILRSIEDHGSSWKPSHLEEIEKLVSERKNQAEIPEFSWQSEDAGVLRKNLEKMGFSVDDSEAAQNSLIALLKGEECEKVLPRYCEYVRKMQTDSAESMRISSKLDALLTCDLTQWAGELRLNYPKNDYKFDRFRKYVSDEEIVSIRKKTFIEDMAKNGVEKAFSRIEPPDPQYRKLMSVRKVYLDAIAAGGWPKVNAPSKIEEAKVGKSYSYVPSLRQRLKAENYPITDVESDVMDQSLVDAVVLYRDVHQLSTKKVIDSVLFKNLTVGPENRLEMIDLALQHYREEAIGSLNYYVKVNVPDFHVEVWKDGKRLARHRIVVGNDKLQRDPETKKVLPDPETLYPWHPNRTPLQTSKINEIIYLPYWNVPARIRIEELEPKLAENPNYYVENNYEEVNVGDPKLYYVRELPNPKNSLGKVKFMFPNPHNTYLHDTPAKAAFNNPVRALSHGCMRVQNPLDLAELLLKEDGQWDAQKVKNILNADPQEQVTIELNHPVDVDVVYINARVDDSGVVGFLSDIYQYDAVRTGKVVLQKLPKPKDWK